MNPRIGILPPGRIENGILINRNEPVESDSYIKNGLVVDKDYRILSKNVWEKLIQIYQGGPAIPCSDKSIYDCAIQKPQMKIQFEQWQPVKLDAIIVKNSEFQSELIEEEGPVIAIQEITSPKNIFAG